MSDSMVDLVSDFEVKIPSASLMGISPDFHLPSLTSNHLKPEIMPTSYDSRNGIWEFLGRKRLFHLVHKTFSKLDIQTFMRGRKSITMQIISPYIIQDYPAIIELVMTGQ